MSPIVDARPMDVAGFGRGIRAIRRKKGWTQRQLAEKARLSPTAVSRVERGQASTLSMGVLDRIAKAVEANLSIKLYWHGEDLDRLLDAAHAGLVEQVVVLLKAHGWELVTELTFNEYGERGSIDILAYHPTHRALLVIEVKSVVPDMQAMLAGVDRKVRLAPKLAAKRGWVVVHTSRLLVLPPDSTARRRLDRHSATIGEAFPLRTVAVRRWLRQPTWPMGGVLFLANGTAAAGRSEERRNRR
jgi:transcriptional regulator with XRE-family HTH domain